MCSMLVWRPAWPQLSAAYPPASQLTAYYQLKEHACLEKLVMVVARTIVVNVTNYLLRPLTQRRRTPVSTCRCLAKELTPWHLPQVAFLDEATAALDQDTEAALYTRLLRACPCIISVGAAIWAYSTAAHAQDMHC